jgi:hypothetical protein
METIKISERTSTDGTLTLRVPLGRPNTEFDVVLVVEPKSPPAQGLPPGYFDLIGSIDDDTFVVHPQPALPPPLEIE